LISSIPPPASTLYYQHLGAQALRRSNPRSPRRVTATMRLKSTHSSSTTSNPRSPRRATATIQLVILILPILLINPRSPRRATATIETRGKKAGYIRNQSSIAPKSDRYHVNYKLKLELGMKINPRSPRRATATIAAHFKPLHSKSSSTLQREPPKTNIITDSLHTQQRTSNPYPANQREPPRKKSPT
jgi:hypothetical protein